MHRYLVLFALLTLCVSAPATAAQPNVLLITVDDMNWDSVGAFGCKVPDITPNIDKLATEGMRFEYAHVTIAICQPTRAVWMTGRYPHRSGALGFDRINPGVPTLVEAMHEAGYYTGLMAKESHVVPTRKAAWDLIVPGGSLQNGRNPKLYHKRASEFLAAAKEANKPFFLMANAQDPHRPFAGSDQERGKRKKAAGAAEVRRTYKPDEVPLPGFLPDLPEVRLEISEYFTSVHRADEVVGALLQALDEAKLADDTFVLFISDHGMPLPFAKTNCYYQSTRTPWIVRYPKVAKPGSVDTQHFISGIDMAPTILDAAGLSNLEGADGKSFLPLLRGEEQAGRERVFTHINTTAGKNSYPMRAVQDAEYGYIWNGWSNGKTVFRNESQSGRTMAAMKKAAANDPQIAARVELFLHRTPEEFYHYAKDPNALTNLAGVAEQQERVARYRQALLEEMRKTDDPQLAAFEAFLAQANE